jgi:site-specific recombinase XerD
LWKEKEKVRLDENQTSVRDWFLFELAINTGLRVQEMVDLDCGDFTIEDDRFFVDVKCGKGGKQRIVRFGQAFKKVVNEFFKWKKSYGEKVGEDEPVFPSRSNSRITTRALQKAFKRCLKKAQIPENKYSIHCLRHTYASHLYKGSRYNLRLVQRQLGHHSMKTTEVYARVLDPDLDRAVENLFKN